MAIGQPVSEWAPAWLDAPQALDRGITGVIVTVDSFGNLISNVEQALIENYAQPVVRIAGRVVPMCETYARAQPGDFLALINSFGVLEIAQAEGDAAASLGVGRGAPVTVTPAG